MLSQLFEDTRNRIDIIRFIDIDQDIVQIDNDKDIKLFGRYFVNVAIETC